MHMVELVEVLCSSPQEIHLLASRQCRHGADVVHSRGGSERLQRGDVPKRNIIATHPRCFFSHSESLGANCLLPPGLVFDGGDTDLTILLVACQAHE